MVFIIVTLVLFAGIAFMQTIQGTFSALIMFVLTVLSTAIAVNFYAPLSQAWLLPYIHDYADACSLAGLFLVTLVVLRTLADNFVRGNLIVYPWADRALAGVISVFTSLLLVGMVSIAFQMLPFGERLLLFERFDAKGTVRSSIFPWADDFAAGLVAKLSRGSLSGSAPFDMTHPDWPGEISAQRSAVQDESRHAVPPESMTITAAYELKQPLLVKRFGEMDRGRSRQFGQEKVRYTIEEKRMPREGYRYLACRIKLKSDAADSDSLHRVGWGQVRLCGFRGANRRHTENDYMIGFRDLYIDGEINDARVKIPVPPTRAQLEKDDTTSTTFRNFGPISRKGTEHADEFDIVFEVPEDFAPWFLEYKRWARAKVPKVSETTETGKTELPSSGTEPQRGISRKGWKAQFKIDYDQTAFTDELPFQLNTARPSGGIGQGDASLSGGRYAEGTIYGSFGRGAGDDLDSRTGGRFTIVRRFEVPSGKALLRLECRLDRAETKLLSQIFSSVQRIAQRYVVDKKGNQYFPVGQYAIVQMDSGEQVELQYHPEMPQSMPKPFRHVQISQMADRRVRVGFLFLIDPGVEMDRFELGGAPIQAQSLDGLVAPR